MATIDRWFDDIEIGERRTTSGRTITEADIVLHAGQTGDFFPHHMDAAWCATQPFKQRIAHGTLVFRDRKSTRLNSSHVKISYAVFCLKKKKNQTPSNKNTN